MGPYKLVARGMEGYSCEGYSCEGIMEDSCTIQNKIMHLKKYLTSQSPFPENVENKGKGKGFRKGFPKEEQPEDSHVPRLTATYLDLLVA